MLYDVMVQSHINPSLKGGRCGLGTEQRKESLVSTSIENTQAENTKPLPERPHHVRDYTRDSMRSSLRTYLLFRITEPPSDLAPDR
jgi:hypothetical protein